jgi:hypothetical protein
LLFSLFRNGCTLFFLPKSVVSTIPPPKQRYLVLKWESNPWKYIPPNDFVPKPPKHTSLCTGSTSSHCHHLSISSVVYSEGMSMFIPYYFSIDSHSGRDVSIQKTQQTILRIFFTQSDWTNPKNKGDLYRHLEESFIWVVHPTTFFHFIGGLSLI